jgi:hypothetical protein
LVLDKVRSQISVRPRASVPYTPEYQQKLTRFPNPNCLQAFGFYDLFRVVPSRG